MRRHTIRRAMLMVVGVMLFVGLSPEIAYASGGGGCGRAVTDDDGTRVSIANFCFGPTILRVRAGGDGDVGEQGRRSRTLSSEPTAPGVATTTYDATGERSAYRFVSSGVYPYVCTYHPGMIGAVVVGNGKPDGAA